MSSTTSVVVPALFGLAGTVLGAVIAWFASATQVRSERESQVLQNMVMLSDALEDLDEEVRARISKGEDFKAQDLTSYKPARNGLQRFCISAVAAGVDSAYALDVANTSLQEMRALSPMEAGRRVPTVDVIGERAAELAAAITAIPFWRRRGRFMHPELKQRREGLEAISDFNRQLTGRRRQNPP